MQQNNPSPNSHARGMSRREFVKLAALAGILAGCSPAQQLLTPTAPPSPTSVPPTDTPLPQPTTAPVAVSSSRPAVIKMYPDAPSRVVYTQHAGVWSGDNLVPGALRQMLDASITKLTDLTDAREAWKALFRPNERVAIKVNAFRNSLVWTHVPLVMAVVQSLQDAGIPAQQIVIFDAQSDEMKTAGFTLSEAESGVRVVGTDKRYTKKYKILDDDFEFSDWVENCDALINMPLLKAHMITGMSFALKNHYGTISYPDGLHYPYEEKMAALNAVPPIRERTRLILGDILTTNLKTEYSWPYWRDAVKTNSIFMSFDPVAHDTMGFQVFSQTLTDNGMNPESNAGMCTPYLEGAAKLGIGTNDPKKIDFVKVNLG